MQIEELYDNAAAFLDAGHLTWSEYWSTSRRELERYSAALSRRAERLKQ